MSILIEGIQVTANVELPKDELKPYVKRGKEKYGRALLGLELKFDGDFVDIHYHTNKVPFERIRRITGFLVGTMDKWNNGKRAEERDRVKHGVDNDENHNG